MKKLRYVLGNDEGMESVQAIGLILIAIIIVALLIIFKDAIKKFMDKATGNVDSWSSQIQSDIGAEMSHL